MQIVLFAAAAVCSAQVLPLAGHGARTQYHSQDELGQYSFGYSGGPSSKVESRIGGVTQGGFSYVDAHGLVQSRNYVSDAHGFRVAGTDIPVDSNTPLAVAPVAYSAPVAHAVAPVAYSAPVAHAVSPLAYTTPLAHSVSPLAYSAPLAHAYSPLSHSLVALARRKRQAIYPYSYVTPYAGHYAAPYAGHYATPYAAHVAINPYPQDTHEVAAAKINHQVQYNSEAARNILGRRKRSVLAYSAPLAYTSPLSYSYSYAAPAVHAYPAPVVHAAPAVTAYAAPVVHAAHPVAINPYPQDTHEVAAAKINHQIQYNTEALRNAHL